MPAKRNSLPGWRHMTRSIRLLAYIRDLERIAEAGVLLAALATASQIAATNASAPVSEEWKTRIVAFEAALAALDRPEATP